MAKEKERILEPNGVSGSEVAKENFYYYSNKNNSGCKIKNHNKQFLLP